MIRNETMEEWVTWVLEHAGEEEAAVFATSLWCIWYWRNQLQFSDKTTTMERLGVMIETQRSDYLKATPARLRRETRSTVGGRWEPPTEGTLKLNCDASVRDSAGASIAGVVRDESGQVRWCFAERTGGGFDVRTTEALAVLHGLKIACDNGVREMIVETDAQLVVRALQEPPTMQLTYFSVLIHEIVCSGSFDSISFVWTRRTGNLLAHRLALFGFACEMPLFSTAIPPSLKDTVLADLAHFVDL